MSWKVVFYHDLQTRAQPARDWLDSLARDEPEKHLAAITAIKHVLRPFGTDVCEMEWGTNLGEGLYEFRIRHPASTTSSMFPVPGEPQQSGRPGGREPVRILLRIFFTTYGNRVVLLCSGYDKGRDSSGRRQRAEVARARVMVAKARAGRRARIRESQKGA